MLDRPRRAVRDRSNPPTTSTSTTTSSVMPPRKSAKPTDKPDQWVFLMPKTVMKTDSADMCSLQHPKTHEGCMILFSEDSTYEISQHKDEFSSWFIDESVQKDGSLYITTPIDPLFLMLPYLIKSSEQNQFCPLDQIIHDEKFPECDRLIKTSADLNLVCDCKGTDDFMGYRFSEEKAMEWLKKKVLRTAEVLKEENVHVGPGFAVDTYVLSKKERAADEYYTKYAFELVSDYLVSSLSEKLQEFLGIIEVKTEEKKSNILSPSAEEPPNKKAKLEKKVKVKAEDPSEDYSNVLKPVKQKQNLTAAQKKLEKIDKTGMKSITSFFSVKPKKT